MKKLWISTHGNGSQNQHRAAHPYLFCADELKADGIEVVFDKQLDLRESWSGLYLHQLILPKFHSTIKDLQDKGVKVALGLDDNNYLIPKWNPAHPNWGPSELDLLDWSLHQVDMVIVSTDPLRDFLSKKTSTPIHVCPNLMDWTAWPAAPITKRPEDPVKIVWAGSVHHKEDLDVVVKPLTRLMKRYNIRVFFLGDLPRKFWKLNSDAQLIVDPKLPVTYFKPCLLEKYPTALHALGADIGICPLAADEFNNSKSNIKALEYILAGLAVVASDSPAYRNPAGCIQLCRNPNDWHDTLEKLICFKDQREYYQRYGKSVLMTDWTWQGWKKAKWIETFKALLSDDVKKPQDKPGGEMTMILERTTNEF